MEDPVRLREPLPADLGQLFELITEVDTPPRWAGRPELLGASAFPAALNEGVLRQWVAVSGASVAGLFTAYGALPRSRSLHLSIALRPEVAAREQSLLADVRGLIARCFPIRQVLLETFRHQPAFSMANTTAGFSHCGSLREHLWLDGRYHDVHVFSTLVGEGHEHGPPGGP